MKISQIMHKPLIIQEDTLISKTAEMMDKKIIGSILVRKKGSSKVIGMLTERDILRKVVAKGLDPASCTVKEIMSTTLYSVQKDSTLIEASEIMRKNNIRRVIVKEGDKIIGIATARNIANAFPYIIRRI